MECAGNGRAFFNPPVAGVQWERGAVGTAAWTGVRLADLLSRAGIKPSARYVWFDGADRGVGRAPDFIRSVPIEKALDRDTMVAYEMNRATLPIQHGFPLRAVVPGWEGAYSVKWLTHIRVSGVDHDGPFVQAAYRYPRRPVVPGAAVPAAEMLPLRDLPVKSIITTPATQFSRRTRVAVRISGFAWAGEAEIRRVEVSTDNGRTWTSAQLEKRSVASCVAAVRAAVASGCRRFVSRAVARDRQPRCHPAHRPRVEPRRLYLEHNRPGARRCGERLEPAYGSGSPSGS